MRNPVLKRIAVAGIAILLTVWTASAQSSLTLSSGAPTTATSTLLDLSLQSPAGSTVAALQWTLTYPPGVSLSAVAGPAATAAGKTVTCASTSSGYACIAAGMNANSIADGVVAIISATISGSTPLDIGVSGAS